SKRTFFATFTTTKTQITMDNFLNLIQLTLGLSVAYVWTFRYFNVVKEFSLFGLSDLTRNLVGVSKVALATLIVAGIWYPSLVQIPAALMGLFMVAAQYFHFSVKNPLVKHIPSLFLLALSAILAWSAN
ncbi:MAG: DoxX family protein, partial [Schleiferiaceae bacterium]|nr:DoxX family protein [Schleiferiaceae bacterium]